MQTQIQEVTKKLRKLNQSDQASFDIAGLESRLRSLENDLVRTVFDNPIDHE